MKNNNIVYLIVLIWLSSCGIDTKFEAVSNINNNNWGADSSVTFNFDLQEDGIYDIYYLVKNKTSYPFYNLYFKVDFRDENSQISDKLQEVILFDKKTGKPFGKGLAGSMEHQFLAFKNQKLNAGKHSISLKQYMRVEELNGIMAIGVKVAKSEE